MILLANLTQTRQYCDADEILEKVTTKNTYIYIFKEVRQKVVIYNVITVGFYPSSINQLLIYIRKFSIKVFPELLPPIRIIRVLNINKNKLVKDWFKVIR